MTPLLDASLQMLRFKCAISRKSSTFPEGCWAPQFGKSPQNYDEEFSGNDFRTSHLSDLSGWGGTPRPIRVYHTQRNYYTVYSGAFRKFISRNQLQCIA